MKTRSLSHSSFTVPVHQGGKGRVSSTKISRKSASRRCANLMQKTCRIIFSHPSEENVAGQITQRTSTSASKRSEVKSETENKFYLSHFRAHPPKEIPFSHPSEENVAG